MGPLPARRAVTGTALGLLIEVLLLHRHQAAEFVIAGITAARHVGATSPALVAIEARKAEAAHRDVHPLLDDASGAELGIDALADTIVMPAIASDHVRPPGHTRRAD
jgi:hypothetical protein